MNARGSSLMDARYQSIDLASSNGGGFNHPDSNEKSNVKPLLFDNK